MALWTCEGCGGQFKRDRAGSRAIRFCGGACYRNWQKDNPNAGTFRLGQEPHNKGAKGVHYSPRTEFKKGQRSIHRAPLGTETIRFDKRTKTPRTWVKVAEPNEWRLKAVLVYEKTHGAIKAGLVVHHKDHNSLNDAPDNLAALTRSQHIAAHRDDLQAAKRIRGDAPLFAEVSA